MKILSFLGDEFVPFLISTTVAGTVSALFEFACHRLNLNPIGYGALIFILPSMMSFTTVYFLSRDYLEMPKRELDGLVSLLYMIAVWVVILIPFFVLKMSYLHFIPYLRFITYIVIGLIHWTLIWSNMKPLSHNQSEDFPQGKAEL